MTSERTPEGKGHLSRAPTLRESVILGAFSIALLLLIRSAFLTVSPSFIHACNQSCHEDKAHTIRLPPGTLLMACKGQHNDRKLNWTLAEDDPRCSWGLSTGLDCLLDNEWPFITELKGLGLEIFTWKRDPTSYIAVAEDATWAKAKWLGKGGQGGWWLAVSLVRLINNESRCTVTKLCMKEDQARRRGEYTLSSAVCSLFKVPTEPNCHSVLVLCWTMWQRGGGLGKWLGFLVPERQMSKKENRNSRGGRHL